MTASLPPVENSTAQSSMMYVRYQATVVSDRGKRMDFVQGLDEMLANGSQRGGNWAWSGGGFQELSC